MAYKETRGFNSPNGLHCYAHEDILDNVEQKSGDKFPEVLFLAGTYCEAHEVLPSLVELVTFLICAFSGIPPYQTIKITFTSKVISLWVRDWAFIYYPPPVMVALRLWGRFAGHIGLILAPVLTFVFFRSFKVSCIYVGISIGISILTFIWTCLISAVGLTRGDVAFCNKYLKLALKTVNMKDPFGRG